LKGDREICSARFLAITLAAAFCCGCYTTSSASLPEVTAAQFQLELSAEWRDLRPGQPLLIEHRLSNHSALPVCIGGTQKFLLNGHPSQVTILNDALCKDPVVIAPPGGTAVWVVEWKGPDCIEEGKAAAGFSRAFPWLICGGEATLESKISLFRMRRKESQWGAIEVGSIPQTFTLAPPEKN
jgi:hypothetical protein